MGIFDELNSTKGGLFGSSSSKGLFSPLNGGETRKTYDTEEIDKLIEAARKEGAKIEEQKPKQSLLSKTVDVISRPLYASAGTAKAIVKGENVLDEFKKGITGQEKETYSDVLGEMGMENKYLKGGLGFALDIALDPSTYFGGTAIKYTGKALSPLAKGGLNVAKKTLPAESIAKFEEAGTSLKDAFGYSFLYGYKTTGGVTDDVTRYLNKLGMAKEDTVSGMTEVFKKLPTEQHTQFADTLLTHRKQIKELTEQSGDRELAKTELNKMTPKFATQEQQDFFEKEYKTVIDKMADDAGLPADKRFEAYFPSINEEKLKLNKGGTPAMANLSDESYKKLYKGVNENEINRPIEALSRQSYKIVYDNTTRETMGNIIGTYGKPLTAFKTTDDAMREGFMLVKDKKFGKELGYLKTDDFNFINNYMYPEFKTLDIMAKASGFDWLTKTYKTMLTAYFPSFHFRNMISGDFQNYQVLGKEAFNPLNKNVGLGILKGADKELVLGGRPFNTKTLNKAINERFGGSSSYIGDLGDFVEEVTANNFKMKDISKARKLGNFIETWQKTTAVSAALRKGHSLDEALDLAEKAGFDYTHITKFESKVMKRLIPFYTFSRKNLDLQLSTMKNHPERILNEIKLTQSLGDIFGGKPTEEDLSGLPEWALAGLGFKVSGNTYLTSFGLPIEEFMDTMSDPQKKSLSSMNPILKYPLESKLGYDFFREGDIKDIRTIAPVTAELIESEDSPQWIKDVFNVRQYELEDGTTRYSASPEALHKLRSLPTARLQSTLEKVFNGDLTKTEKAIAVLTGAKIYDIDIELNKYFEDKNFRNDLENDLLMQGIGNEYTSFYMYKDDSN